VLLTVPDSDLLEQLIAPIREPAFEDSGSAEERYSVVRTGFKVYGFRTAGQPIEIRALLVRMVELFHGL
jgi:hypothetical protein